MNHRISAVAALTTLLALTGCATGPALGTGTPIITSVATEPTPPVAPRIHFSLKGSGFNPQSSRVFFTGPGCPSGCEVPSGALDRRTDTEIAGLADLAVGTYSITARNGEGAPSNAVSITLIGK